MKAGTDVSLLTIGRSLNKQGLHGWTPWCTPLLTKKLMKGRVEYARRNLDRPAEFWDTVLRSDRAKLELFGHMDQRFVWRKKGKAYDMKNTITTVKHGGGSVMMWGCFSAAGTGNLDRVIGIMNSQKYQAILRNWLGIMPSHLWWSWTLVIIGLYSKTMIPSTFQVNQSLVKESVLEWSSQSPDLNPIENLCWDLKKAVGAQKPSNLNELEAFAWEEWAKVPRERCQKLVSTYWNRLLEVIEAKGCSNQVLRLGVE